MDVLMFMLIFYLFTVAQRSSTGSLTSNRHQYNDDVEFAVETDTATNVLDFCKRHECSFLGKVTSKYFHIKCKERKLKELGGEKKIQDIARIFFQINSLERQHFHMIYRRTNDPQWSNMWNLNGDVLPNSKVPEAWEQGLNGSGITIAVLDDGIQVNHPDLRTNIDAVSSYDFIEKDSNITPDRINSSHGTMVAGIIAAEANNNVCIVGVAHASRIIGIRIIDDDIPLNDITEAKAFIYHLNEVDIYSNSWGPTDNQNYAPLGPVSTSALMDGVALGRNGKGSIYIFAAGNGGKKDNCNADGYVSNLYTIPITSIGIDGKAAPYSEVCACAFAATYSGISERKLTSTAMNSTCVSDLEGTSFSAPEASAIVALALQANPSLTWRDVQHLIVQTSKRHDIDDGFERQPWQINGAGLNVSQIVGFGMMDAEEMVAQAMFWTLVDPQLNCSSVTKKVNKTIHNSHDSPFTEVTSFIMVTGDNCIIHSLEKVQIEMAFSYESRRGDVTLILKSPSGTVSYLMTPRPLDSQLTHNVQGDGKWNFTSVHFWGEKNTGKWELSMKYDQEDIHNASATLVSWKLLFYGTSKANMKIPENKKINERSTTTAVVSSLTGVVISVVSVFGLVFYLHRVQRKKLTNRTASPRIFITQLQSNSYNKF